MQHVGFLFPQDGIGKYNKMFPYFHLDHTTLPNYTWETIISKQTLSWNFKFFHDINQKFKHFFFFLVVFLHFSHCTKRKSRAKLCMYRCIPHCANLLELGSPFYICGPGLAIKYKNHVFGWGKAKIIGTEQDRLKCWIKEAIEIRKGAQQWTEIKVNIFSHTFLKRYWWKREKNSIKGSTDNTENIARRQSTSVSPQWWVKHWTGDAEKYRVSCLTWIRICMQSYFYHINIKKKLWNAR